MTKSKGHKFRVKVQYQRPMRRDLGQCIRTGNSFVIKLNDEIGVSPTVQFSILFHELSHMAFWMVFKRFDERREHKFCYFMERMAKQGLKKYLGK
jgi:predicted SprT family Zn-dependent metalloprotease